MWIWLYVNGQWHLNEKFHEKLITRDGARTSYIIVGPNTQQKCRPQFSEIVRVLRGWQQSIQQCVGPFSDLYVTHSWNWGFYICFCDSCTGLVGLNCASPFVNGCWSSAGEEWISFSSRLLKQGLWQSTIHLVILRNMADLLNRGNGDCYWYMNHILIWFIYQWYEP